jgi:hypothetical protein
MPYLPPFAADQLHEVAELLLRYMSWVAKCRGKRLHRCDLTQMCL